MPAVQIRRLRSGDVRLIHFETRAEAEAHILNVWRELVHEPSIRCEMDWDASVLITRASRHHGDPNGERTELSIV